MNAQPQIVSNIAASRLRWIRGPAIVAVAIASAFMVNPGRAQAVPSTGPLPNITPQARASDLVQPATVFVQVNWDAQVTVPSIGVFEEQWETGCTGFIVNPDGYIVTAGHCLDDGREGAQHEATVMAVNDLINEGDVSSADRDALIDAVDVGNVRWKIEGTLADSRPDRDVHVSVGGGKAQWNGASIAATAESARVLDVKPWSEGDVGLLKIEDSDLPTAVLATNSDVQIGEDILAIGYPLQFAESGHDVQIALTNRNGQINSVDTQGEHGPGNVFYETSAVMTPGQSGCPVTNLQGVVVGLCSYQQGGAYFIVPSSVIAEVIGGRFQNAPGRVDAVYREGLDDYYHGYYSDAIEKFDQVLSIMPNLQPAADKRLAAAQLKQQFGDQPKPEPGSSIHRASSPLMPRIAIGAGGGLALIALVIAVVLWRRRRRRSGALSSPLAIDNATAMPEFPGGLDREDVATSGSAGSHTGSSRTDDTNDEHGVAGQLGAASASSATTDAADPPPLTEATSRHSADDGWPDTPTASTSDTIVLSQLQNGDRFTRHPFSEDPSVSNREESSIGNSVRSPVLNSITVERFCPRCSAERAPDALYCSRCGSQLHRSV